MTDEQVAELIERLEKAVDTLQAISVKGDIRLQGKIAGVRLALSYLREYVT